MKHHLRMFIFLWTEWFYIPNYTQVYQHQAVQCLLADMQINDLLPHHSSLVVLATSFAAKGWATTNANHRHEGKLTIYYGQLVENSSQTLPAAPIPDDSAMSRKRLCRTTSRVHLGETELTASSYLWWGVKSYNFSDSCFSPATFRSLLIPAVARIVLNHLPQLISRHSTAWAWITRAPSKAPQLQTENSNIPRWPRCISDKKCVATKQSILLTST